MRGCGSLIASTMLTRTGGETNVRPTRAAESGWRLFQGSNDKARAKRQ